MNLRVLLFVAFTAGCGAAATTAPPPSDCRCEAGCISACEVAESATTTYRKVERDPTAPEEPKVMIPEERFETAEVVIDAALSAEDVEKVLTRLKKKPEDLVAAFHGDFARRKGTETVVVLRTGELLVLTEKSTWAKLQIGSPVEGVAAVRAVQLIDSRTEIVIRHIENETERFTVLRVVGRGVGRVFDIETAGRTIDFVHRGDEKAIRVADTAAGVDQVSLFRWNPWEGMFRVPAPAPTAPPLR